MFSGAPDRAPLPGDSRVPPGASSSASHAGVLFFTPLLSQAGAQRQAFRLSFSLFFFSFFGVSLRGVWVFILLLILTIC